MKRIGIDKMFADVVARYIGDGYVINTETMAGHQGEVAKVDLCKGDVVLRVDLERSHVWDGDYDWYSLIVGKVVEDIRGGTIWTNRLEVIEEYKVYQIGRDWFTLDEKFAKDCANLKRDRLVAKYDKIDVLSTGRRDYGDGARKIVLERVRKLDGCTSVKLWDIKKVRKEIRKDFENGKRYWVFLADVRKKVVEIGRIEAGV